MDDILSFFIYMPPQIILFFYIQHITIDSVCEEA